MKISLDANTQERERQIKTLRAAIDEGIQSGFHKDFDLNGLLAYLEDKYINKKKIYYAIQHPPRRSIEG